MPNRRPAPSRSAALRTPRARDGARVRGAPFVGALLRMSWQAVRERLLAVLGARGFGDINQTHFTIFQYPPPHGVRATDLARRASMTKQAMNYLLQQVETLGYIERRASPGHRSLVYLTPRGWQVTETIWTAMQELEAEWAQRIGPKRFADLLDSLRQLAAMEADEPPTGDPAAGASTRRSRHKRRRHPDATKRARTATAAGSAKSKRRDER
jgi:DNA-binding MarR family transcriptional regulator